MLNQPIGADFTVPAGTLPATPAVAVLPTIGNWITTFRLTVPRGHNGVTGFRLLLAGSVIIPYFGGGWVVASDQVFTFQVDRWAESGQLVMEGYNTGVFNHTFHVVADAYPTEPGLPVTAALAAGTPQEQAITAALGTLDVAPDQAAATVDQGTPEPVLEPDLSDLEPDGTEPAIDVGTFASAPEPGALVPLGPAHPVDRSRLGGHRAAARPPESPPHARGGRAPAPIRERPPTVRTPPPRPKPAPAPKRPRGGKR